MSAVDRIRPSWWYYVLALAVFAGGMVYFFYDLWHELPHIADSLVQVVVPGEAQLELKHGPNYTIFLEQRSVLNGKVYSTADSIGGLECKVNGTDGEVIPVGLPNVSTTYELGGRSGHSVLEFRVPANGNYKFACRYGHGASGPKVVLAVGSGVWAGILRIALTGSLAFFGGIGAAFLIGLVTFLRRHQAKTRAAASCQLPPVPSL